MTIQDLGSIGELIAAIATIATLGYLAVQLRHSTATARAGTTAAHSQASISINALIAQNPEVARILFTGLDDPAALTEIEKYQFNAAVHMNIESVQQNWRFHNDGVITDSAWAGQRATLAWFTNRSGFASYWEIFGPTLDPDFVQVVHDAIRLNPPPNQVQAEAAQQNGSADSA